MILTLRPVLGCPYGEGGGREEDREGRKLCALCASWDVNLPNCLWTLLGTAMMSLMSRIL